MSQLVQMMLKANVLTPEQAKEARAQQVVYGDRIGTNLLDCGFVTETLLAQGLGALHQVPYAAGPQAVTTPTVARTLSAALATRLNAVPARWDGQVMWVYMMDPRNTRVVDELEAAMHRRISGVVVTEARMWELLNKNYKARRGLRALALDGDPMARARELMKQASKNASAPPQGVALGSAGAPPPEAAPPPAEDLSDESSFFAMYQQAGGSGMSAVERAVAAGEAAAARKAAPQAPPPEEIPELAMGTLITSAPKLKPVEEVPPPAVVQTPPPPAVVPAPPPLRTPSQAVIAAMESAPPPAAAPASWAAMAAPWPVASASFADVPQTQTGMPAAVEQDLPEAAPPEPPPPVVARDESPLDFATARKLLEGVEDRNAIAHTVLRYALTLFKRSVLLTVQRDLILGWDALGAGVSQEVAEKVILPLQQPSIFRLASESRAHFLGPVPKQPVNFLFLKLIGGKVPRSAFVIPVVVRGKVVNLLYCDNGGGQEAATDIGELLILAQHINRSYETLLNKAA